MMLALTVSIALVLLPAFAQDKPRDKMVEDNMEILKQKIRADKKLLVAANMELTESEAKAFWPVYEGYQQELENLHVRSAKLIEDYINNYKTMTDDSAKNLLSNFVTIEGDHVNLMKSYLPRFQSALPGIKTSRYYQIENKIWAVLKYELARQIPLVQ